jgi:primase-polymerase (primpol)-like protein
MSSAGHLIPEIILKLRIAVAFLGEKEQCAWWSTRFLGSTGKRFLEFNYPRSAFAAGVTAASEAAKTFHDRRIGKGHVSHLFRMPHTIEERLRALLLSQDRGTLSAVVESKEAAIRTLADLSKEPVTAPEGPACVGNNKALLSGSAISKLASLYLDAFKSGRQTLPYFTTEEG